MTVGERLKKLRGKKSRREVAKAIGISTSAITMYELDKRIPRDEIKSKIANYYKKSVATIFYNQNSHNT